MFGVQFPRMNIEHKGLLFFAVQAAEAHRCQQQREEAKISPTAYGQGEARNRQYSGREFPERARGSENLMQVTLRTGHAVAVVNDGEDAAVDAETLLGQDLQCPLRLFCDGETSALSSFNFGVKRLQFVSSVFDFELPIYAALSLVGMV